MIQQTYINVLKRLGFTTFLMIMMLWGGAATAASFWCQFLVPDPKDLPRAVHASFRFDPFVNPLDPGQFCNDIGVVQQGQETFTITVACDKDGNETYSHIQDSEAGTYTAGDRVVDYDISWLGRGNELAPVIVGDTEIDCSITSQSGVVRRTTIPGPPRTVINDSGLLRGKECCTFRNGDFLGCTFEPTLTAGVDPNFYFKQVEATCNYLESQ